MVRIRPFSSPFPATFLDTVLKTFSTASFDQLFNVVHHVSSAAGYVAPQRPDEQRPYSSGWVASTYSTCRATSSNPAARYRSPIIREQDGRPALTSREAGGSRFSLATAR